jgi:D-alanyl-D-alanine carboxypeptidase (penicillin-binding protein 5/6)
MKLRNIFLCVILVIFFLGSGVPCQGAELLPAEISPTELYALSATLMDGETGRILYEKEGNVQRANASTTKILTCILALEACEETDVVAVSSYAASMPKVRLGMQEGEYYYLGDLLYSLMLESHNDSAVAIAEHAAGSVEAFADQMNEKAASLGCESTHFITPNGLDASDEDGIHGTTSGDLAKIMAYCAWDSPVSDRFLEVTQRTSYYFSNLLPQADGTYLPGSRSFTCDNKNAYLQQNPECISGKTGYTSEAGYCYVSAVYSQGRKLVVALLASGWPNNKTYKWQDSNRLYSYGTTWYHLRQMPGINDFLHEITVTDEANPQLDLSLQQQRRPYVNLSGGSVLMADWEELSVELTYEGTINADQKGVYPIGTARILLGDQVMAQEEICVELPYDARDFLWYFRAVMKLWQKSNFEKN